MDAKLPLSHGQPMTDSSPEKSGNNAVVYDLAVVLLAIVILLAFMGLAHSGLY